MAGPKKKIRSSGKSPHPVDVYVGNRLRARRRILGMSQIELSKKIGITFQQLQKYENASNRISASRLYDLANALGTDISYFFDGYASNKTPGFGKTKQEKIADAPGGETEDVMASRETTRLLRAYYKISDEALRQQLTDMAKAMAKSQNQA